MKDVSIIGAGVAGLTVAAELVEHGCNVRVFERSDTLGTQSCSRYAGGMLAPWCERESAEEEVITLGKIAADWWQERTGLVTFNGSLVVAQGRDRSELNRFAARTSNYEPVNETELADLEPDLAGRFQLGLHFKKEAHLNPRRGLETLYKKLLKSGVEFEFGADVFPDQLSGKVVDARGFAARDCLSDLRGVKGEMLLLKTGEVSLSRPIRMLHPRIPLYIVPREDGVFMIGATMIESGDKSKISARSMLELLGAVYALHPAFGEAEILETGCDVRPAFPDNLPRVARQGNVISINGLYRHGFLLAPAMARQAAKLVQQSELEERHYANHG